MMHGDDIMSKGNNNVQVARIGRFDLMGRPKELSCITRVSNLSHQPIWCNLKNLRGLLRQKAISQGLGCQRQ